MKLHALQRHLHWLCAVITSQVVNCFEQAVIECFVVGIGIPLTFHFWVDLPCGLLCCCFCDHNFEPTSDLIISPQNKPKLALVGLIDMPLHTVYVSLVGSNTTVGDLHDELCVGIVHDRLWRSFEQVSHSIYYNKKWGQRESNSQPPDLESGALPIAP